MLFSKIITCLSGFFKVFDLKIWSLESEKIGSLQVHTGYLTLSFKKTCAYR